MSVLSKLPFQLRHLSEDLKIPSVSCSGWPPPSSLVQSQDYSSITNVQNLNAVPLLGDDIHGYREGSIGNDIKTYFDKLRLASHKTTVNTLTPTASPSDDTLGNLIESIRPSPTENSDATKNNRSQVQLLRGISVDYRMIKSIQRKDLEKNTRPRFVNNTFSITTVDGDIFFDFSKQSIDYTIYIQLMQLVLLSNLDKIIQKIFHPSGEYHHVDYKENRRHQLAKDEESQYYSLSNIIRSWKSSDLNKTNSCLTMAKAVHFRNSTGCFVLEGIDISPRFQYDRKIVQDACRRFQSDINADANTKQKETDARSDTKRFVHRILVLCTPRMREVYRLFESLFKSYISSDISIIYITFDQFKPFLTKYEPTDIENEGNVVNENTTTTILKEDLSDEIDIPNGEYLLDYLQTSSLILIFMKHLDQLYLTTLIQWCTDGIQSSDSSLTSNWNAVTEDWWLITSDYQTAETVFNIPKTNLFLWATEHHDFDDISIVISSILGLPIALSINYQNYSMVIDGMSIIDRHCQETTIDGNVCVRMALLRIWSSICKREITRILTCDDNLRYFGEYVQALLTEYGDVRGHETVERFTSIHGMLSSTMLLQENLNEQNPFSSDIITIASVKSAELDEKQTNSQEDEISHPHSSILLDRLTPRTLGVLMGVYQMSIFFEKIIRNHQTITFDRNQFHISN